MQDTLRFHDRFGRALQRQGVLTSVATMCTANVTGGDTAAAQKAFCGNGPSNGYGAAADAAIMREMGASAGVQRFLSMGAAHKPSCTNPICC